MEKVLESLHRFLGIQAIWLRIIVVDSTIHYALYSWAKFGDYFDESSNS